VVVFSEPDIHMYPGSTVDMPAYIYSNCISERKPEMDPLGPGDGIKIAREQKS
jgi:hypothetical protein